MSSLIENAKACKADFSSIKRAIISKGVDVPNGSRTNQYAEKISNICGIIFLKTYSNGRPEEIDISNVQYTQGIFENSSMKNVRKCILNKSLNIIPGFQNTLLETIEIPPLVDTLQNYCFTNCINLQLTSIPEQIKHIGQYALAMRGNQSSIVFLGTPLSIDLTAFHGCDKLLDIFVPWSEGTIPGAPWGAVNSSIHYDWSEDNDNN